MYDPFLGTGTTAIVSKKMGRHYIGSEISDEYFKISEQKLDSTKREVF